MQAKRQPERCRPEEANLALAQVSLSTPRSLVSCLVVSDTHVPWDGVTMRCPDLSAQGFAQLCSTMGSIASTENT